MSDNIGWIWEDGASFKSSASIIGWTRRPIINFMVLRDDGGRTTRSWLHALFFITVKPVAVFRAEKRGNIQRANSRIIRCIKYHMEWYCSRRRRIELIKISRGELEYFSSKGSNPFSSPLSSTRERDIHSDSQYKGRKETKMIENKEKARAILPFPAGSESRTVIEIVSSTVLLPVFRAEIPVFLLS